MLKISNIKNKFKIAIILLLIILAASIISFSLSAKLENDAEVEFNSELTYYLDITYDGVDKYGIESNDSTTSNITSDYIYIEDKLPEGLIFNGFVTTSDKTFGAVSRDDSNNMCSGSVIDDSISEDEYRQFIWLDSDGTLLDSLDVSWGTFLNAEDIGYEPTRSGYYFTGWDGPYIGNNLSVTYIANHQPLIPMSYIVEWYNTENQYIKSPETRTGTLGFKSSATSADKIVNGYTFDVSNKNNIESIILSEDNNKIKLYFKSTSEAMNYDDSSNTITTINENTSNLTYNYHGLHYDESTRTVSFKVKDLQAGCKLTIGIKTITPSSVDDKNTEEVELRRDFYNYGTATEKDSTKISNTVHAWMGKDKASLYNVKYEYTGDIPENAPALPTLSSYSSGSKVGVSLIPIIAGYRFTGWTSDDITIEDNSFIMPSKDITLTGSFEKLDNYKVTYEIEGIVPENYIPPLEKSYSKDTFVKLDSLKKGDVYNGYRFLGWESTDVIINDDQMFIMPEKNVTIIGHFELVTYKVEYQFYDTVLPPNSDTLLPTTKYYRPGETINLDYPSKIEGYKFLGWYKESNFKMPEQDVIIYGEWKIQNGTFSPSIKKEIVNYQDYYRSGDIIFYRITVTNNADYEIKNVMLEEKLERATFYQSFLGLSYHVKTPNLVEIPIIKPHSSVEVTSQYIVNDYDQGTITNEVELISALAENNYDLDTSKEYKDSASFQVQSRLNICKEINSNDPKVFQFHITDNENYDSWLNLSNNECTTIYLKPNSYNISEIIPQEYVLNEIILSSDDSSDKINNGDLINIELGKNYDLTFKNRYKKKGFYHSDGRIVNKVSNERTQVFINVYDYTKEYDGSSFNDFDYDIIGLEDSSIIEIDFKEISYKNAGNYQIYPNITWNNPSYESKYDIIINPGQLTINKRNIVVQSGSSSKEYDGAELTNNSCQIIFGEILPIDTYKCTTTGSQLNVGSSQNTFNFTFDNLNISSNYNIVKSFGALTITEATPKYTVIYKDGFYGNIFEDDVHSGYIEYDSTPPFEGSLEREGYSFMGWTPTINPTVKSDDANKNNEIIYKATWKKK